LASFMTSPFARNDAASIHAFQGEVS
jgi:hypothetical protein